MFEKPSLVSNALLWLINKKETFGKISRDIQILREDKLLPTT